jgi:hypothetical protein
MLPKFRSFVRPIIRSFVRSFIVPIHHSSFVHTNYSPSLFIVTIHHRYYSPTLFIIVTIQRYYSSSLLFINDIYNKFFIVTINRYYSLFIRSPQNFNYTSIMLSSPPTTSQTHIPVTRTPVTVIFLPVGTSHLVTHPRFLQVEHANFEIPSNQASKLRFQ